jgi:hypothetical protein
MRGAGSSADMNALRLISLILASSVPDVHSHATPQRKVSEKQTLPRHRKLARRFSGLGDTDVGSCLHRLKKIPP